MSSVRLILYKNGNVCIPGERITGTVDCYANSIKIINAIKVVFEGKGKTEWTESESYFDENNKPQHRNVVYSSEENYLTKEITLLQGRTELIPGNHSYPFEFALPPSGLPSSFEGTYGHIRYRIRVILVRPWDTDLVHELPLEVSVPLNLNYSPDLRNPVTTSVDKTLWSCFCNNKNILVFNMSLPVTGFVPGQDVNVGAYVQNLTRVNVENVQFKIVQNLEFIAHNPRTCRKYMKNVIITRTEGGIGAHGEKSWTSILKIPIQKNYPNFESSNIMKASYCLKASAIVPTPHRNLENKIALVIGGIPLTDAPISFSGSPLYTNPAVYAVSTGQAEESESSEIREDF